MTWTDRAADCSPSVQRSRERSVEQARVIVDAAQRLLRETGEGFTTQELAKEAGVALQTFYSYFSSKDELILAVIEESIIEGCAEMSARAAGLDNPLDRLRVYVTGAIGALAGASPGVTRFITAEHYRLHQVFPEELATASGAFAEMLVPEIEAAVEAGELTSSDPVADAWFVMQLSMSTFHHYAYVNPEDPIDAIADRLWTFCLRALGGDRGADRPAA